MSLGAPIAGVILTGGRSRRMGSTAKAHHMLCGRPLIRHVIDRMKPQADPLVLGVEKVSPDFATYGLRQLADPSPGSNGPLGGLLSALMNLDKRQDWLLLAPCDAPFIPLELGRKLHRHALESGAEACVIRYQAEIQPTFSIWNRSLLPELANAVNEQGMGGFKQFLNIRPMAELDWDVTDISPFFNINDPAALVEAQRIMKQVAAV